MTRVDTAGAGEVLLRSIIRVCGELSVLSNVQCRKHYKPT